MSTPNLPKTFLIYASTPYGKEGYLRLISHSDTEGNIEYNLMMVKSKTKASKFLNYDNSKKTALQYAREYELKNMKIIDSSSGRTYNVKENTKEQTRKCN